MNVRDCRSNNPDKILLQVEPPVLDDLHCRLQHTRWPQTVAADGWALGTDVDYLRQLIDYWATGYDWRQQEQWLNSFSHYRSTIDGIAIHYIHQRSADADAIPLLLLHGWPGSFLQMLKLLPLLTNPVAHGLAKAPSFHVVIASLPGFGFSDAPTEPGMNLEVMAGVMAKLMHAVQGYDKYAVRGSDIGGVTVDQMARHYPQQLLGAHLTQIIVSYGPPVPPAPGEWAARSHNVVQFSETATVGHFLEWEEPLLVATDMQRFFSNL